jgi:hypothetical protein
MVFGPVNSQGLGVKDPYVLQGLTWLKTLLRYGDRATLTGHLIRQSMELVQLEIGRGNSLFQLFRMTMQRSSHWLPTAG